MATVFVGQGSRDRVRQALRDAKVTIVREGYSDTSTTTWAFVVRTRKTPDQLQDIGWTATGWVYVTKDNLNPLL